MLNTLDETMATKEGTKSAINENISSSSTANAKTSLDYHVKPIFNEPKQLYGREQQIHLLQSCFRRLIDDTDLVHNTDKEPSEADSIDITEAKDEDDGNAKENALDNSSSDDTSGCSQTLIFQHCDSLADTTTNTDENNDTTSKEQARIKSIPKPPLNIRYSVKEASDVSITYESTLFCNAPQSRECILLYGSQGVGKRSLAQHALEDIVKKRGGWFIRGDFERDYFGGGWSRSCRRIDSTGGKIPRGVRFADEKSNDDMNSSSGIPLSGFISVCRDICKKLLELRSAESVANANASDGKTVRFNLSHLYNDTVEEFMQSLSFKERLLLTQSMSVSELRPILGIEDGNESYFYKIKIDDVVQHKKKLHYAFQKFISVVCQLHGPLVIRFNNCQFADSASLDLLESILFDREIGKLMIVGCIQSSDKDTSTNDSIPNFEGINKKLYEKIELWRRAEVEHFGLCITDVELDNLSLDSTKQLLVDTLSTLDDVTPLAELCYEYSHGNAYLLKRFMEILYKKKLLHKDNQDGKWSWDINAVTSMITSSNVEDFIMDESVNKLPKKAKALLLLATCIGSTYIDEDLLFLAWSKFERKSCSNIDFQSRFRLFINESLFRKVLVKVEQPATADNRAYYWVHESMINALSGNVNLNNIASLRYEIGCTLDHTLAKETDLLVIAKLINSGGNSLLGSLDSRKRVKWAEKNLDAAKKALLLSEFELASHYAEAGIEYLPSSTRWKEHSTLMLELSSILGEVAGALGNSRLMERWCEEIICRNELKTFDKLRAYKTLITNLAIGNPSKAISLCLAVLKKLDCTFKTVAVARDNEAFTSCIEETRVLKKEEFLANIEELPRMDDREKIECVKLLCQLCQFYTRQSKSAFFMAISRAARWTYHYGLTIEAPVMFAYLGLAYIVKQEFRVGAMNGEAALALLDKTDKDAVKVKALYIIWYKIMPWSRHVRDSSRPLLAAYNFGLQSGDIESAMKCIFAKLVIDLISGRSLLLIEKTCQAVVPQMEHARCDEIALLTRVLWQTVLNLISDDDEVGDPTLLNGTAFNEKDFNEDPKASIYIKQHLDALKSYLCLFIGEHVKGAELALERENKFIESVHGCALSLVDLVSRGIPMIEMKKTSKKRTHSKALSDIIQQSKTWSSKGVCSIIHLELLLEAEQAALERKLDVASDAYKKGMAFASRAGFTQDVALINYRYASFLLAHNLSQQEAEYHLDNAITSYEIWGSKKARRKIDEAQNDSVSSTRRPSLKNMSQTSVEEAN